MTTPADDRRASLPGLRVIVESGQVEPDERKFRLLSLLASDRCRVETLLPEATGYSIERRDLQRHFQVFVTRRKYQEIPIWDLISPMDQADFLKRGEHWRKHYDTIQNSATREFHIRFTYEKTDDQAPMFGVTARRWRISRRDTHDEKYGENWTEAITDAWYLDSDEVKLRYPAFSEKLIHHAFSVATGGDERVIIEQAGERPAGLCALSETTTHSHIKGPSGKATDRKFVHVSKITTLAEETLPQALFEPPPGFKKIPLYPSRFTMARLELGRSLKRFLRKHRART